MASGRNFYEPGDAFVRGDLESAGTITGDTALTTPGNLTAADVVLTGGGSMTHTATGSIARTDTAAKTLFTLPANAKVVAARMYTATASDAATTATVSVGWTAAGFTDILNTVDVKGGGTGVLAGGAKTTLGTVGNSTRTIKGIYAETGTASTTGGPFVVYVDYTTS